MVNFPRVNTCSCGNCFEHLKTEDTLTFKVLLFLATAPYTHPLLVSIKRSFHLQQLSRSEPLHMLGHVQWLAASEGRWNRIYSQLAADGHQRIFGFQFAATWKK